MALSDCPKCWETPCVCGHEYKEWSTQRITVLIDTLQDILTERYMDDHLNQIDAE